MLARSRRLDAKTLARPIAVALLLVADARAQDPAAAARSVEWTQLKPVTLVSAGGATFTTKDDGSILVGGPSPDKDLFTLDFETELQGITAVRLEALADDSLPYHGPGRASNGNFVLNEMVLEASAKLALRYKPVALQNASADFVEGTSRKATQVHDGECNAGGNGWAVYGAVGQNHQLIAETKSDVKFDGGGTTMLRFTLHFNWGSQHELGRFRLSVTNAPRPVLVPGSAGTEPLGKLQERINAAIDRGVAYLEGEQQLDGSWSHEPWTYRNGATALGLYTLVKSGVSKKHPAVVRALEVMRGNPTKETYSLGCLLMALGALDDPTLVPWMKEAAEQLLASQKLGFNYGWGGVDLSNTQYGVLGLRAAAMHGVPVPDRAFEEAAQQALLFQHGENVGAYAAAGFSYNRPSKPTSSMTAAGTGILAIADEQLRAKGKGGLYLSQAKRGVEWLAQHWSVDKNLFDATDRWNLYYLYGLERVASVLQVDRIGEHDWYREGARRLCDTQGSKGEWGSSYGDHVIDTCFALLFLNKATAVASGKSNSKVKNYGSDDPQLAVSLRASGDTPLTMWISAFGTAELAKHAWPNEAERGLHVKSVQYVATGGAFGTAESVLATVGSDGLQPCGREKFGAQSSFPLPGRYTLFARVTVLDPPDGAGGAAKLAEGAVSTKEVELLSSRLDVDVEEALDPELLQYARDPARNLLAGQKVTASASSQINGDWVPAFAADNLQSRGWAARNDDATPTLTLELERPVRATTVLITPARIGDTYNSKIVKLQVTVNGRPPAIVVDVPDTPQRRKLRIRLPQALVVRKLEFKVLERRECANAEKAVGLAEVELQADKPGESK
jgi:hypothetical protein